MKSNNSSKLSYIAEYVSVTAQDKKVALLKRDLRLSQIAATSFLEAEDRQKLKDAADRLEEMTTLVRIVMPLILAVKNGKVELEDLQKLKITQEVYQAIAEMSYFSKPLEELTPVELIEIVDELFGAKKISKAP